MEVFVGFGYLRYFFIYGNKFDIDGYLDVVIFYFFVL